MKDCPPREQLQRLLADVLPGAVEQGLSAHVDACSHCQQALEQLTTIDPNTSSGHVTSFRGKEPPPGGSKQRLSDSQLHRLRSLLSPTPSGLLPESPASARTEEMNWPAVPGYEVLRVLGQGGTAVVYEVLHLRLNRRVALKMIRAGDQASPEQLVRFCAEGEFIARLRHPNIVQIYEVGTHNKQPYLALELLEGGSLAEAQGGRPVPALTAAGLIETLARAVDYSHRQGIVHRDLKPSNVLLQRDLATDEHRYTQMKENSSPLIRVHPCSSVANLLPKITDFGLAKHLDTDTGLTKTGFVMGTPNYMAPEQVRGQIDRVGPTTDVYSLGAILYELLTGRPPFQAPTSREVMNQVTELDPVSPARLQPHLPRDLESICLKCLEKEPARRYPSAEALADDLRRFRNGEPIRARRVSELTRAWRWAKRNPAIAGLLLAVAVALLTGSGGSTYFAVEASRRAHAAEHAETKALASADARQQALEATRVAQAAEARQRKLAEDEGALATAVNDFLRKDLLALASPHAQATPGQRRHDIELRTVLDRAAERIPVRFPDRPLVEAAIRQTIGEAYRELGVYALAQPHLEAALAIRLREQGTDHLETLSSQNELAALYRERGQYAKAEPLYREALAGCRRTLGLEHSKTLACQENLATLYQEQGQFAKAESLLSQALEVRQRTLPADHPGTLGCQVNLATVYVAQGQHAKAEALYRQALEGMRQKLGADHPDTLACQNNLAALYQEQRQFAKAEPLFVQALELSQRTLPAGHPDTLRCQQNLASVYHAQRLYAKAEPLYRQGLEVSQRALGPVHPLTLGFQHNWAVLYKEQGQLAKAEPLFRQALEGRRTTLSAGHPHTLVSQTSLAELYWAQGQHAKAEPLYLSLVELRRRKLGRERPQVAYAFIGLGTNRLLQQNYAEAEPSLRESLALFDKVLPDGHWLRFANRSELGACLVGLQKYAEAEPLLLAGYEGLQVRAKDLPNPRFLTEVRDRLVQLYEAWGKPEQAARWRKVLPSR